MEKIFIPIIFGLCLIIVVDQKEFRSDVREFMESHRLRKNMTLVDQTVDTVAVRTIKGYKAVAMKVEATGYCPNACCCGKWADGKTATGRSAQFNGVAVDPSVIPLGSQLQIPGYCEGVLSLADDVGGAIKGSKIDLRFKTHQDALDWGRKKITIVAYIKK